MNERLMPPELQIENQKSGDQKERSLFLRNIEMYHLPGDPPLKIKDAERYIKTTTEVQSKRDLRINNAFSSDDPNVRLAAAEHVRQLPEGERFEFADQLSDYIKDVLKECGLYFGFEAIRSIPAIPEDQRTELQEMATKVLGKWIEEAKSPSTRDCAVILSQFLLEKDFENIVGQGLSDNNRQVQLQALKALSKVPQEHQQRFKELAVGVIENVLNDKSCSSEHGGFARLIPIVPEDEQQRLWEIFTTNIEEKLKDKNPEIRKQGMFVFLHGPVFKFDSLYSTLEDAVKQNLDDQDLDMRDFAASVISKLPESSQPKLQEKVRGLVEQGLGSDNFGEFKHAIMLISNVKPSEQLRLIQQAVEILEQRLKSDDESVRKHATILACSLPDDEHMQLFLSYPQEFSALRKLAQTTPLYDQHEGRFVKGEFDKSGSGTTLLDVVPGNPENSLRNRVIIRHIKSEAYEAWKDAFEAFDFWKEKGFDYVPVEPIVKARVGKKPMTVDVFTRVLQGPAVGDWKEKGGLYLDEIYKQVERIKNSLKELQVEHGHTHMGNFIVVFERDSNGELIFEKTPRVYVIDFDQAVSSSHNTDAKYN
ncbi:MAG: hypothetical protein ABIH21_02575 [Patescibacteria group bacterium]